MARCSWSRRWRPWLKRWPRGGHFPAQNWTTISAHLPRCVRRRVWSFLRRPLPGQSRIGAPEPGKNAADLPWVLTGHQVEFYHAGVWAKVVAADVLTQDSEEMGGPPRAVAFDLLVDHDLIEHLGFDVPLAGGDGWRRESIEWAEAENKTADALAAPSPEQFEGWDEQLAHHQVTQSDTMAQWLSSLRPTEKGTSYVEWMSRARSAVERALGLVVHHVPTSLLCQTDAWFRFVWEWIANAPAWTPTYNRQLAAYRSCMGIQSPQHPMPDLDRNANTYELPFWVYRQGDSRQRLMVRCDGPNRTLLIGDDSLPLPGEEADGQHATDLLKAVLASASGTIQVRPRALTLTLFARLFLADVFIHGIGGALYDQITDGIFCELFPIRPPYSCVSAAWLLPLGKPNTEYESVPELLHRRHHLEHNPQQAINPFTALHTDIAELFA